MSLVSKAIVFLSLKIDFVLVHNVDPEENYVAFHLALHSIGKFLLNSRIKPRMYRHVRQRHIIKVHP